MRIPGILNRARRTFPLLIVLALAGEGEPLASETLGASGQDLGRDWESLQRERAKSRAAAIRYRELRQGLATEPDGVGSVFGDRLRSGGQGPAMVVIPAGRFSMGCVSGLDCRYSEKPVHDVTIPQAFALSVHEVTFEDYDRFKRQNKVTDNGWGRGWRPVINVSWDDAKEYVAWLSSQTRAEYRLPSEAEWEYAARAGSTAKFSWGNEGGGNRANCEQCGSPWDGKGTAPVGAFAPNAWGLHDMHGNVWEWVEDCWNDDYAEAPSDGSAWLSGECYVRVLRGGSWGAPPRVLRVAYRGGITAGYRSNFVGFRVARTLAR